MIFDSERVIGRILRKCNLKGLILDRLYKTKTVWKNNSSQGRVFQAGKSAIRIRNDTQCVTTGPNGLRVVEAGWSSEDPKENLHSRIIMLYYVADNLSNINHQSTVHHFKF